MSAPRVRFHDEQGNQLPTWSVRADMLIVATDYQHYPRTLDVTVRRVQAGPLLLDLLAERDCEPSGYSGMLDRWIGMLS